MTLLRKRRTYAASSQPDGRRRPGAKIIQTIKQILTEKSVPFTVFETQYKEHAVSLAKNAVGKG